MDTQNCIKLLKKAGCRQNLIDHCIAVAELAGKMAKQCGADYELVVTGALLHDIGRAKTHGVDHAVVGAEMARRFGLDERIAKIIERHIGAGIPAEEAEKLGLPRRGYVPRTLEEKIVAHADNLIRHTTRITINESLNEMEKRLGSNHPALQRLRKLHEELSCAEGLL
jgi:uncharacterized protein